MTDLIIKLVHGLVLTEVKSLVVGHYGNWFYDPEKGGETGKV